MKQPQLLLFTLLFASITTAMAHAKTRSDREDDIREVLLRRLAPYQSAKRQPTALKNSEREIPEIEVYFFSYWTDGGVKDPSDQFLERFVGWKPPIKRESESYVDPKSKDYGWSYVKEKGTQATGMRFSVGHIKWLSRNRVNVRAGYAAGGLNAGSAVYWLAFIKGHWIVRKTTDEVVS